MRATAAAGRARLRHPRGRLPRGRPHGPAPARGRARHRRRRRLLRPGGVLRPPRRGAGGADDHGPEPGAGAPAPRARSSADRSAARSTRSTRWAPFLFDAVTFAASWVLLGRVRADLSPAPRPAVRRRAVSDLAEGLRFTWHRPVFRTLLLWSPCANLVINALFVAATLRLIEAGYPAWSIGLVETAAGACGILGALCAPWLTERFATGALTVVVAWSFVPLLLPLVLLEPPGGRGRSRSSLGVFLNPAGNAGIGAYKMAITPPEIVGRVQSVNGFASWSTMPLAPVVAGVLLATLGGPATMAALAGLVALVALIPTLSRSVRSVPRPAEWLAATRRTRPRSRPGSWSPVG